MLSARLGSLNAVEEALGKGGRRTRWHTWIGGDLPSADRLGEVAALIETDDLRAVLYDHHGRRKRKKTLPPLPGGLRVLILDGHEVGASYLRNCKDCYSREVKHGDEVRTQYYHRYVMAYLLCEGGSVLLDVEMQSKGKGEIDAAMRLLERLQEKCPRAFNVVAGDALYLDPGLCRLVLGYGKDFIAVLKNENRDLIKDFRGLIDFGDAATVDFQYNGRQCHCHDIEGFGSWSQLGSEVRVVSSEETRTVRRQLTKEKETLTSEWLWATSLSKDKANTRTIVRLGHGRWDIENQGFNELVNQWHADHIYHHDVNAIVAILLLLYLVYNLFHVWLDRALKPQLREKYTALHFARLLKAEFYHEASPPT
ncbi:MAG: transposase [Lentisphaeria bacterium]|nr:transposase [Lentisphaeria bacterium]